MSFFFIKKKQLRKICLYGNSGPAGWDAVVSIMLLICVCVSLILLPLYTAVVLYDRNLSVRDIVAAATRSH